MTGIIYYGAGNIFSLTAALDRLGAPYQVIVGPVDPAGFDRFIIPGVGHAGKAMQKLDNSGLVPFITSLTKPVLGICVGMQLLSQHSEEGDANLLGIVPLRTRLFDKAAGAKVPHMGWTTIEPMAGEPLFSGLPKQCQVYFVHSYYIEYNPNFTIAKAQHATEFSAAVKKDNFLGVQFHPEKSGPAGEAILNNFIKLY